MMLIPNVGTSSGSYYFWTALEIGTSGAGEEINVAKRDGMASMR